MLRANVNKILHENEIYTRVNQLDENNFFFIEKG